MARRVLRPLLLLTALLLLLLAPARGRRRDKDDDWPRPPPPPVVLQPFLFRGSGCAQEDMHVDFLMGATDGEIRLSFSEPFSAVAGPGGRFAKTGCYGVLPLMIVEGKRVGITQVRIAGHAAVSSPTGSAQILSEFFFPGVPSPNTRYTFLERDNVREFELEEPSGTIWSRCGGRQTFRINLALIAKGANTQITMVEGTDLSEGVVYEVSVKECVPDPRSEL